MGREVKAGWPVHRRQAPLSSLPDGPTYDRRWPGPAVAVGLVVVVLAIWLPTAFVLRRVDHRRPASAPTATATSGAPTTPSSTVPAVAGLKATPVTGGDVLLTWSPSQVADLTGYTIRRNDTLLKFVSPILTRYDDITVQPSQSYLYTIQAFTRSGHSEAAAPVQVVTPGPPPLADARIDGIYEVFETYVSGNLTNHEKGQLFDTSWIFTTLCDEGACDVRTKGDRGRQSTLRHDGVHYAGTVFAPFGSRCGSVRIPLTYTIALTVSEGTFERGVWTATGITGTLGVDIPSSASCGAGHGILTLAMTWAGLI
jgi:hypothetical protein